MNNQLDIQALLKSNETEETLYKLVNEISHIQVDGTGHLKSSVEHLAEVKYLCDKLSALLYDLIKDVALVLGYSFDRSSEVKSPICHFFIIRGMSEAAKDLSLLGKICEHAIGTKNWPNELQSFPKHSVLKLLTQLPGTRTDNAPNFVLSEFIDSATAFNDCQVVNLRIFSEALVSAHGTGEIENYIAGALEFNNQWIGVVEAILYMCEDTRFSLNEQKAA